MAKRFEPGLNGLRDYRDRLIMGLNWNQTDQERFETIRKTNSPEFALEGLLMLV